jgi:hypothetical protein
MLFHEPGMIKPKNTGDFLMHVPEFVETSSVGQKEYPLSCFGAQVCFAAKWSEVTGEDFAETLVKKTSIYRAVTGELVEQREAIPKQWAETLNYAHKVTDATEMTHLLYDEYSLQPWSDYKPHHRFGAFDYAYNAEAARVKVHFENPVRGENPLASEELPVRAAEFRQLLLDVRTKHPEATTVVSASWIRESSHYRELFPPDLDAPENLMDPDMFFAGDSLWGQFIDRNGNGNQRVYSQFLQRLKTAKTQEDMLAAFPFKVLRVQDPIEKYYRFYHIGENPDDTVNLDSSTN